MEIKFCEYGCGKEAKVQLKGGRWCCEGRNKCIVLRKKNGLSNIGKHSSLKTEETKRKMRGKRPNATGDKNHFYGKHHTKEVIEHLQKNTSARRPEVKRKMSETRKNLFKNPIFLEEFRKNNIVRIKSPNNQEIRIIKILNDLFPMLILPANERKSITH